MKTPIVVGISALLVIACSPAEVQEASTETSEEVHLQQAQQVLPPSGAHPVGIEVHAWVDEARPETATEDPDDRRQLLAQIWYPAAPAGEAPGGGEAAGETYPFFPQLGAYQAAFGDAYPDSLAAIRTQSIPGAAAAAGPFPVVLFFHGWNAQCSAYTGLLQELASHGFVAVGVDQPYAGRIALPSGEVTPSQDSHFSSPQAMLESYGADGHFVLQRLAALHREPGVLQGRLDLERLAAVGHSNGAISAVQLSHTEPRVRGAVLLDSFDQDVEPLFLLDQPLLLVRTGGARTPSGAYRAAVRTPVYDLEIQGGSHGSATDLAYLDAPAEARPRAEAIARQIRRAVVTFLEGSLADPPVEPRMTMGENATLTVLPPG